MVIMVVEVVVEAEDGTDHPDLVVGTAEATAPEAARISIGGIKLMLKWAPAPGIGQPCRREETPVRVEV